MALNDPIGDMLTRIRNGQSAFKSKVKTPASKLRESVLEVLKKEGFIKGFERINIRKGIDEIIIELKYYEGQPVISEVYRVSKPGRRVYAGVERLPKVYNGLGISILSTSKGVMSDHEARKANVGGEVICKVF
jgi:small subunit ribosomal protein S8